tara:strand:+ start:547 stop:669 length:123 start_codon:yes stop_codon:yes gene_type:complete
MIKNESTTKTISIVVDGVTFFLPPLAWWVDGKVIVPTDID